VLFAGVWKLELEMLGKGLGVALLCEMGRVTSSTLPRHSRVVFVSDSVFIYLSAPLRCGGGEMIFAYTFLRFSSGV